MVVGIDLGTTFSAVAYIDDSGTPRVISNIDGKKTTPSVVMIKNGAFTVGDAALNSWFTDEEHVIRWVKRAIGDDDYRFQNLNPIKISAEIVKALISDSEMELGEKITEAVITCPAYFNSIEIENTKRAGEMAGLNVIEIVKEPTAAAVYYGIEHMKDQESLLVCDLGGGTYDSTILKFDNGTFCPIASAGSRELGGHDWTMDLVKMVAEIFMDKFNEDPRNDLIAGQKLYEDCEKAKRDFARVPSVSIPCQYKGNIEQIDISRDDFEASTEWRIDEMITWSEQTLSKAKYSWNDIDHILLVGGSSRLRRVSLSLEEISGIKPVQTGEADLMVALGAAILANKKVRPKKNIGGLMCAPSGDGLMEVSFKRIIARSLGTRIIDFDDNDESFITNSEIIPHSTESPVSLSREDYSVLYNKQEYIDVPVVEFEDEGSSEVLASYRFQCLKNAKKGDPIKITFIYDVSGIVTVEAFDMNTQKALLGDRMPYQEPKIEDAKKSIISPRCVVFTIDVSYSMGGSKLVNAKQALIDNAKNLIDLGGECYQVGIVSFASDAELVCEPTSNINDIENKVSNINVTGSTAMHEGIELAMKVLKKTSSETTRDMVMLTDGMPDDSYATLKMAQEAKSSGITLSIIGVGSDNVDDDFLSQITPNTLIIDDPGSINQCMATLLMKAEQNRG